VTAADKMTKTTDTLRASRQSAWANRSRGALVLLLAAGLAALAPVAAFAAPAADLPPAEPAAAPPATTDAPTGPVVRTIKSATELTGEALSLAPKHTVGESRVYMVIGRTTSDNYDPGPPPIQHKSVVTHETTVKVTCVNVGEDGKSTYELVYERVRAQDAASKPWDSRQPAEKDIAGTLASVYRPVIGVKFTLEIDADGTIRMVRGGENLAQGEAADGIKDLISAATMRLLFGPIFNPARSFEPRRTLEQWEVEDRNRYELGRFITKTTFTAISTNDETAEIDYIGTITLDQIEGQPESPLEVRQGAVKGKLSWDAKNGRLNIYDFEQLLDITGKTKDRELNSTTHQQARVMLLDPKPRLDLNPAPARPTVAPPPPRVPFAGPQQPVPAPTQGPPQPTTPPPAPAEPAAPPVGPK
jgi:hypothetical protein